MVYLAKFVKIYMIWLQTVVPEDELLFNLSSQAMECLVWTTVKPLV